MEKLIIFDLDGVLLDSREIHYTSLNMALESFNRDWVISREEHLSTYDGLPTTKKLELLTRSKNVPRDFHQKIWELKQDYTIGLYDKIQPNDKLKDIFQSLRDKGLKLAVASNSIRRTMMQALRQLDLLRFVDYTVANDDINHPKPFPEMYWKCMIGLKVLPRNTVIIEDSHIGRQGAIDSGGYLLPVKDPLDLLESDVISKAVKYLEDSHQLVPYTPWKDDKLNVLIPMAGAGSRFEKAGYTFPKPLIEVNGKPMIQVVCDNLNIDAHYIFIVRKEHYDKYNLKYLLNLIKPGCDIIQVDELTEGAACTTLLAESLINSENPLLLVNSDQYLEWNSNEALYAFSADQIDGGIVTFDAVHPKWSFVKLDDSGFVTEVAEKKPISNHATVGVYYWKHGSDYVKYAKQMIDKDIRTNGEFYVAPVFNEAIGDGKKIRAKNIDKLWGLGTPEDLNIYLEHHKE